MIRIAISGACGRMGQMIARLAAGEKDLRITAAIEHAASPRLGDDYGQILGTGRLDCPVRDRYGGGADVLIDFSAPEAALKRAGECAARRTAVVIGTTGLSDRDRATLRRIARRIPVLQSNNMSVGVNLLLRFLPEIARALGKEYDVEIVETHHRFKKDAPSGTAISLAESIAAGLKRDLRRDAVYGRSGIVGERRAGEIGIHAVRAGDVVGEHRTIFATLGETLEITHRAHSREIFARGALRAVRWIARRKPGLYRMRDVIGGL